MDKDEIKCHTYKTALSLGGRVVIPATLRREIGVKEGDEIILVREGKAIRLMKVDDIVSEVQSFFARFNNSKSIVDEFLEERKEEAKREQRKNR